jgi:L-ribulose-5-phosphate 3-epimerase
MHHVMWPEIKARVPFSLCVVAEEISPDLERSLAVAHELGIEYVELDQLWGQPIYAAEPEYMARAKRLLEHHGIGMRMAAPITFKTLLLGDIPLEEIEGSPAFQQELAAFRGQLKAARYFEAPLARVYSGRRDEMIDLGNPSPRHPKGGAFPEEMQAKVAHFLTIACREAERAGVMLALENVRSCWGNSGHNLAIIRERVGSPWLQILWDPSNGYVSGEEDAFPAGYEEVKPHIVHMHLKDAVVVDASAGLTRWERIGDGAFDFVGQMRATIQSGFAGCVSIETHWAPEGGNPELNTRRTYAGLMDVLLKAIEVV